MKLPKKSELTRLLKSLKSDIGDEDRASEEGTVPGMQVTVGWSPETGAWSYQTGDNSFTGGAYWHPFWGVVSLYRRSNSAALADDIREQLADGSAYWRGEHAAAKA